MKRLVISDLHLGAAFSREDLLLDLLEEKEFDELILAGDIIEFLKVPHFTEDTKKIFNSLRKVKKPIVYVVGNHDKALNLSLMRLLEISGLRRDMNLKKTAGHLPSSMEINMREASYKKDL